MWLFAVLAAAVSLWALSGVPASAQSGTDPYVWVEDPSEGRGYVEGAASHANFWVRVRPATPGGSVSYPITVWYNVSSQGNATAETGWDKQITIASGSGAFVNVPITDDDKVTKGSRITVTLEPDRGYRLDHDAGIAAFVNIVDDDHGPPPVKPTALVSVSAPGQRSGVPVSYTEGEDVTFRVLANPLFHGEAVSWPLTVRYRLTQVGEFITESTATATTPAPTDASAEYNRVDVTVPTSGDSVSEDDGTVTVEILPGDGYRVSSGNHRASARVLDDDTPRLRFGASSLGVLEGPTDPDPMPVLYVDPAPHEPLSVRLATSDGRGGRWGAKAGADYSGGSVAVTIPAGTRSVQVDLGAAGITIDDDDAEDYESFWLTIQADPADRPAYLVGRDGNSDRLEVVISDDDGGLPQPRLTANADGTYTVPASWPLVPDGVSDRGGTFRLLLLTHDWRDATSANIADYDAQVQASARGEHPGGAHEALKAYASLFKAVGSTATVSAIDHIDTASHPDAPVFWLGGPRTVARQADLFSSNASHRWENQDPADRRTAGSASHRDDGTRGSRGYTGTYWDGQKHATQTLGSSTWVRTGRPGSEQPISSASSLSAGRFPFYAISPVFRVAPSPRLEFDGAFSEGTLEGAGARGTRAGRMLIADEPAACGSSPHDVSSFGPVSHAADLVTYRVRLVQDPLGNATVDVHSPQLLRLRDTTQTVFRRPYESYQGGITVRPAGAATTLADRGGSVRLSFGSGSWDRWQTVSVNVHCADHDSQRAYQIQQFTELPGDRFWVPGHLPGSVAQLSAGTWSDVRVKVIDTKAPAQPADLSVPGAYGGTLTAAASADDVGYPSIHCYGSGEGRGCRWFFSVAYRWDTTAGGGQRNDWQDAEKHFSAFRVRIEGDDSLSPPAPTYVHTQTPGFLRSKSVAANSTPYHAASPDYGLAYTPGSTANPGNPVYRFTITPVTIRNAEVPGEAITVCVQLQSPHTTRLWRKTAAKVDCSQFTAPTGEVPVIGLGGLESQMSDTQGGGGTAPKLTIAADALSVTEGGEVTYTITANPPPTQDAYAEVAVKEQMGTGSDAVAREGRELLVIPAGTATVTWTVTAYSDDVARSDGTIVAELNPGTGYTLGDPSTVTTTLLDDDTSDKPEISISGGGGGVTASPAPPAELDVKVTVAQSGDWGATTGQRTVTVPTSGSVTFTVATTDDDTDETDGTLTATVNTGSGWTVSPTQGAATVAVADNDDTGNSDDTDTPPGLADCGASLPTLSISSPAVSRSDRTAAFELGLDCKPSRAMTFLMVPVRDGTRGSYILVRLTPDQTATTVTLAIGSERQLGLAVGWANRLANPDAHSDVTYTD